MREREKEREKKERERERESDRGGGEFISMSYLCFGDLFPSRVALRSHLPGLTGSKAKQDNSSVWDKILTMCSRKSASGLDIYFSNPVPYGS